MSQSFCCPIYLTEYLQCRFPIPQLKMESLVAFRLTIPELLPNRSPTHRTISFTVTSWQLIPKNFPLSRYSSIHQHSCVTLAYMISSQSHGMSGVQWLGV